MIVANKIVFIGDAETPDAQEHIDACRKAGDDLFVADIVLGEQLVRRIIDADEIHLWHVDEQEAFELGMVYFYGVHAVHYKLHWKIMVFGVGCHLTNMFQDFVPALDAGERLVLDPILLPPSPMMEPTPDDKLVLPPVKLNGEGKFELICDGDIDIECEDCKAGARCDWLREKMSGTDYPVRPEDK